VSLFPDIVGESFGVEPYYRVDETPIAESEFALYRQFIRPRWIFELGWSTLSESEALSIANHVLAQAAAGIAFEWFTWFATQHWIWIPIGTGDGVTTVFTIPAKETSDQQFFTGSGTSAAGTVTVGTGTNGEDKITFTVAPASGALIWCNLRGRRRFNVRYEQDEQPPQRDADSGTWVFKTRLVQTK